MLCMMSAESQGPLEEESGLRKTESLPVDTRNHREISFVFIRASLLLEARSEEFSFSLSHLHVLFAMVSRNLTRTSLCTSPLPFSALQGPAEGFSEELQRRKVV